MMWSELPRSDFKHSHLWLSIPVLFMSPRSSLRPLLLSLLPPSRPPSLASSLPPLLISIVFNSVVFKFIFKINTYIFIMERGCVSPVYFLSETEDPDSIVLAVFF